MALALTLLAAAVAVQTPVVLSTDTAEAARTCAWDDHTGEWRCDQKRLERFRLVGRVTQDGTTPATVKAAPVSDGTCVRAVAVEISGHPAELVVDWSRVVFSVNGTATQAAPGFARKITDSLSQRPSVAPAGTVLREQIFPVDVGCVGEKRPPYDRVSTLELHLPHTVGGEPATFVWRLEREWAGVTEAEAFGFLAEPVVRRGSVSRPPVTLCCTLWGPGAWVVSTGGCLAGALGAELLWLIAYQRGLVNWGGGFIATWACLAFLGSIVAVWGVIGGAFTDLVWAAVAIGARTAYSNRAAEERKHLAWVKKREALGLTTED